MFARKEQIAMEFKSYLFCEKAQNHTLSIINQYVKFSVCHSIVINITGSSLTDSIFV